jgi:TonB family protein
VGLVALNTAERVTAVLAAVTLCFGTARAAVEESAHGASSDSGGTTTRSLPISLAEPEGPLLLSLSQWARTALAPPVDATLSLTLSEPTLSLSPSRSVLSLSLSEATLSLSAPEPTLTPPKAVSVDVPYPTDAPAGHDPADATIKLRVDADGSVSAVQLVTSAGPPFDEALLLAGTRFQFAPARLGHEPVAVEISYTQRFVAPPPPTDTDGEPVAAGAGVIRGLVVELGTGEPVDGAHVVATVGDQEHPTTTDAKGYFKLTVPPGTAALRVIATGYEAFVQQERVSTHEELTVKYGVLRTRYDPYETLVIGRRERLEVDRKSLRGPEIRHTPGTFGDPFRIVSPGSTGFMLDGVRLPMLFHLLALPAVVHPELVDRVDFYAGGFGAEYGGATGGLVNGVTRRAGSDERLYEVDLNLLQTGLFVRQGFPGAGVAATVAGRLGYPGVILSLLDDQTSLSYWDYQARLDGGGGSFAWTVSLYGARDHLMRLEPSSPDGASAAGGLAQGASTPGGSTEQGAVFMAEFHRLDLRAEQRWGSVAGEYRLVLGHDETIVEALNGDMVRVRNRVAEPRVRWKWRLAERLRLYAGLEGSAQPNVFQLDRIEKEDDNDSGTGGIVDSTLSLDGGTLYRAGLFSEVQWEPLAGLLLTPGVRTDIFHHSEKQVAAVDPRLSVRVRVHDGEEGTAGTWLKAATGLYHQPPRLFIPVPGVADSLLDRGLERALHCVAGLEHDLAPGLSIDVQVYYNDLSPIFLDLPGVAADAQEQSYAPPPSARPGEMPRDDPAGDPQSEPENDILARFDRPLETLDAARGRSYGVELMLRRRRFGRWYGWLAYTLSRSERQRSGHWQMFDYDRAHILNAVGGLQLPRNWSLGLRVLVQTGTPVAASAGAARTGRSRPQWRADVRVDKRAIWNDWMLDFYVDVINVALAAESGGLAGNYAFRYVLPTVGFRAVL